MRTDTFQPYIRALIEKAEGVTAVQDQDEAADWPDRPRGLAVTFASGATVWFGMTMTLPPGQKHESPEDTTEGEPPATERVPDVPGGKDIVTMAERWLVAVIKQAENRQVQGVHAYGDDTHRTSSGVGVRFHSGGGIHMAIEYVAAPGQRRNHKRYELQGA